MKLIKIIAAFAVMAAVCTSMALAEGKKLEGKVKDGSCCDKATKAGKTCEHKCCVEAAKAGKVCEKCNK
ncbi:MAG TPA: hypothetical protein VK968_09965 [Roseimicrobium sp.]|nr:hypothetical protein [Roseimicrobium sp.]